MATRKVVFLTLTMLLSAGCATKGYVRQNIDPLQQRVDEVADQTQKQGTTLTEVQKGLDEQGNEISATKERVTTVEGQTGDLQKRTDRNARDVGDLRQVIANFDDYKPAGETAVHFGFDKTELTPEAETELDSLAAGAASGKRFFITVEGFTDQIGSEQYNLELSRKRADNVVRYLVTKHNIPVYRIFVLGFGEQNPVDPAKDREARAKNRRVEVRIFSAEGSAAVASSSN